MRILIAIPVGLWAALVVAGCGGGDDGGGGGAGGGSSAPPPPPPRELPEGTSEGPGLSRRAIDQQVIDALVEAGSDASKPHRIEHQFTVDNPARAAEVASWGEENGFVVVRGEGEGERRPYYTVDLVRETPLDIELISRDTRLLETLAMQVEGIYDGWGCAQVVE